MAAVRDVQPATRAISDALLVLEKIKDRIVDALGRPRSAHVAELLESPRRERGDSRLLLGRRVDERCPLEGSAQELQLLVIELEDHGRSAPPDVHGRSFRKATCQ